MKLGILLRTNAAHAPRDLLVLAGTVSFVDFVFGATYIVLMLRAGIAPSIVGFLIAFSGIVALVLEVPSGAIGDKWGHKRLLVCGLVVWGAGQLMFGLASSTSTYAIALVLWSVGMAMYSGAPTSLVVNELNAAGLNELMASTIRRAQVVRWVASGSGAALVLVFGRMVDQGVLVSLAGVMLVLAALWVLLCWPGTVYGPQSAGVLSLLRSGVNYAVRSASAPMVGCLVVGMIQAVLLIAWQPLVADGLGWGDDVLGAALLVLTVAAAVGASGAGRLKKPSAVQSTALLTLLLGSALLVTTVGSIGIIIGLILAEVALGAALSVTAVWSHEVYPDHLRNTLVSINSAFVGLGMAGTQIAVTKIWESVSITFATGVTAGTLTVAGIALIFCTAQIQRRSISVTAH